MNTRRVRDRWPPTFFFSNTYPLFLSGALGASRHAVLEPDAPSFGESLPARPRSVGPSSPGMGGNVPAQQRAPPPRQRKITPPPKNYTPPPPASTTRPRDSQCRFFTTERSTQSLPCRWYCGNVKVRSPSNVSPSPAAPLQTPCARKDEKVALPL